MTTGEIDRSKVRGFAGRLTDLYAGGMLSLMINIGDECGLFAAMAVGPATSAGIAERAGLDERYVREWLGAMTSAGFVTYDSTDRLYTLPPEHAMCLTGETIYNLAPRSSGLAYLPKVLPGIKEAFHSGGGVPYAAFRPEFTEMQDTGNRVRYRELLVKRYLTLAPGLVERLVAGMRVADIGCGTGLCVNLMAKAFPASMFFGYDISDEAIARAQREANASGTSNATFEVRDVRQIPSAPPFDLITAFDAIHDQVDPAGVLRRVHDALAPGGVFFMVDIKLSSNLDDNAGNTWAAYLYSVSVMHCMTVSLAEGGAGLGTMWGHQVARRMLAEAGFKDIELLDVPGDPANGIYLCSV
ncbi:MAG: class I SAM-dependent methyltransferase [Dehalococcoidia bacterium]